jgi:hypothetical protein
MASRKPSPPPRAIPSEVIASSPVSKPSIGVGPSRGQSWSNVLWFQATITWPTCDRWPVSDWKRARLPKIPSCVAPARAPL